MPLIIKDQTIKKSTKSQRIQSKKLPDLSLCSLCLCGEFFDDQTTNCFLICSINPLLTKSAAPRMPFRKPLTEDLP